MVTTVTGYDLFQNLPLIHQINEMKNKLVKFSIVCLLCLAFAYLLVWTIETIIN
jgi:hypothetical protein